MVLASPAGTPRVWRSPWADPILVDVDRHDDALTEIRTFLIADVRGYTLFTHERGDEAAAKLAAKLATR
jgi:class 3 adenylate cyclase